MKPTLLILAAGMGSRYGGLKQVEPVGPNGETIMDYSIYDAVKAGFGKIVFVIRKSFAPEFKEKFQNRFPDNIKMEYVCQELEDLPEGFSVPEDREKPWGTAHAILVTKNSINEPFCAINADDFYGFNAFHVMADFLRQSSNPREYAMVGYTLENTLSDFGSVSRGVCEVDEKGLLKSIVETTKIERKEDKIIAADPAGGEKDLSGKETVSMNMWGFKPSLYQTLEAEFVRFLESSIRKPKAEMFIPSVVFDMIREQKAIVKVLKTDAQWFGVTYREDTPFAVKNIKTLIEKGDYPEKILK